MVNGPSSGLHHYTRQNGFEKARIHLRLDPDGSGTLIVNANSVMHLNPTAAFMAWLILEEKTEEEKISALRSRYSVSRKQAQSDLSAFHLQLDELLRPDGACPIHELDLDMLMPWKAQRHKPLFVKQLCGLLQQFNAAAVVFDQVIVSGENVSDTALKRHIWNREFK